MKRLPVIVLSWGSVLGLALVMLCVGRGVDRIIAGQGLGGVELGIALLGVVASGVCAWGASLLSGRGLAPQERELRHRVLRQVFALGASERTRERTGRIVSTATDGVERAAGYRATFIAPMIASSVSAMTVGSSFCF